MDDKIMREMYDHHMEISRNLGVPNNILLNQNRFVDWYGYFDVGLNNRQFKMELSPTTLAIRFEGDTNIIVAHMFGSDWTNTPLGRLFHTFYQTSEIQGAFQIFKNEKNEPFKGFEQIPHTHMMIFTDRNNEKQFAPIFIDFSKEEKAGW